MENDFWMMKIIVKERVAFKMKEITATFTKKRNLLRQQQQS